LGAVSTVAIPPPPTAAPRSRVAARIRGIDAARALAIFGMVAVHIGPVPQQLDGSLYGVTYGRASVLFVVLAGVGVSLLAGERSRERVRRTRTRLAFRAAVLFPVGLLLDQLPHGVAVILQYYAVYFLAALLLVRVGDAGLLLAALGGAVAAPVAYLAAQVAQPEWFEVGGNVSVDDPAALARALLLTGYYPTITWVPPLAFGMWVGRRDLRAGKTATTLLLGGAAAAAGAYAFSVALRAVVGEPAGTEVSLRVLALSGGHTEMPLSLIGATAVACAVLGGCLLVAARLPRVTWPLVATGQLALSVYVIHLVVIAFDPELLRRTEAAAAAASLGRFAVVTVVLCMLYRVARPRGPLEELLNLPFRRG